MTIKALKKVNGKVQFHYRENKYLTTRLKKVLCNALIQPRFGYGWISWILFLNDDDELFLWYDWLTKSV